MAITESLGALGSWTLELKDDTPRELRDKIQYLGHVTVHTGRVEPALVGDGLLRSSRYTGVLRGKGEKDEGFTLTGCGMEFWLGDEDNKGTVIEDPITFDAETYTQTVRDLLALGDAVVEGTFHAVAGTYTGTHQFQVLRTAIAYVATTGGIEYRINGDATMDLGEVSDLYVTDPKCLVIRRGAGVDMDLRALLGKSDVDSDVEDFTTRVVLIAASTESQVATGDADIDPGLNPYKDVHGNPVKLTRMVSESTTDATNADARAQLQLNRFSGSRDALALSTVEYDINGSARVGDFLWVYNPDIGLYDDTNEVQFRGARLNPVQLRMIETTWPVSPGLMVAYRDPVGTWLDLTDYVKWESGQTTIKVGGYNRSLTGSTSEPIGRLPQPDTSVPDVVVWIEPFLGSVYQSPVTGAARGEEILAWTEPLNTNATPITDGSHYEIRYRQATIPLFPVSYDDVEDIPLTCDQLEASGATWDNPLQYPATDWQHAVAPFDSTTFRLQELVPSMAYETQIRAVDLATPTNYGEWSNLVLFQTTADNVAPATPAPPEIASNPMAVQMTHRLGRAEGGEFNLDRDLHHLELHGSPDPLFTPDDTTMLGKVIAQFGMITGAIPIVQSFNITVIDPQWFRVIAVDETGNKSSPSTAVQSIAGLIDQQYISSLTVSKITAGEISADWIIGGYIRTATQGPRVEMNYAGIQGYDVLGSKALDWKSSDGSLNVIGNGGITITDGALIVYNAAGQKIVELGECADGRHGLQVYKDDGTRVARIGELESSVDEGIEFRSDTGQLVRASTLAFGIRSSTITTAEATTTSGSYVNLATVGPFVTVEVGNSGQMIVIVSCTATSTVSTAARVSFDIAGPSGYFSGAAQLRELYLGFGTTLGDGPFAGAASKAFTVTGLPSAGSYTVQVKYRTGAGAGGTSTTFFDRHVIVIPF